MRKIIANFMRWMIRHFILFLLIVSVLAVGRFVHLTLDEYRWLTSERVSAQNSRQEIEQYTGSRSAVLQSRASEFEKASLDALSARIDLLGNEIQKKKSDQKKRTQPFSIAKGNIGQNVTDYFKVEVEISLLEQEQDYLQYAQGVVSDTVRQRADLEKLRQAHAEIYQALQANEAARQALKAKHPVAMHIPGTSAYDQLRALQVRQGYLLQQNAQAASHYQQQRAALAKLPIPAELRRFAIQNDRIQAVLQPLNHEIESLNQRYETNWVKRAIDTVNKELPSACFILLSAILAPIAVKFMAYFVMAPIAARRPAIQVLPDAPGNASGAGKATGEAPSSGKVSAVSQTLQINGGEELLVHPEYIQSTSLLGRKDTQWLLDWSYPLTSLASGMMALTRFRTSGSDSIVISATRNPLMEIGVIPLHKGDALVLQPHNLVGVVQDRYNPIQITRHWRLGSLHAWLTLQLRYLVFHGPGRLIIKGCRGIRLEKAGAGRSINQAATLGFSAGLQYSTRRCETFWSYFLGKQELFNDYFEGSTGYYVYEEIPYCGSRSGITGRGVEGLLDSILKVFGV